MNCGGACYLRLRPNQPPSSSSQLSESFKKPTECRPLGANVNIHHISIDQFSVKSGYAPTTIDGITLCVFPKGYLHSTYQSICTSIWPYKVTFCSPIRYRDAWICRCSGWVHSGRYLGVPRTAMTLRPRWLLIASLILPLLIVLHA